MTIDLSTWQKHICKASILLVVPEESFDLNDPEDKKRYKDTLTKVAPRIADMLMIEVAQRRSSKTSLRKKT